jgi:large subunit ribosomal protein L10
MSKQIKQMEMDSLKKNFQGVRDLVLLSMSGITCQVDNQMRLSLRKKNIYLQMVKNSLTRRVFDEAGIQIGKPWEGPTILAWGADSIAELSKEIESLAKKHKQIVVKTAIAEGQEISFAQALKMPTKAQAIGRVVSLALAPASRLVSQLLAPAANVAGQIKTLSEKQPEGEAAAPPAAG